MRLAHRRRLYTWYHVMVTMAGLVACRSPRAAHPLAVANQGAEFEVRLSGCSTTGVTGRRFGTNVRTALLWSSERVHSARYFPCVATIDAVRPDERHAIYRLSITREGSYVEELVRRVP